MRMPTMVALDRTLLDLLDARAARDSISRSQLIRAAVTFYLDADMAAALQHVVDEYARRAETDEELRTAHEDARALVEEEPW